MEKKFFQWLGFGFVAVALTAITVALIGLGANLVSADKRGGDLATWFGAIGMVGTLIGTIILATSQQSKQRKIQKELAVLTAANLTMRIAHMQVAVRKVMRWLDRAQKIDQQIKGFAYCATRLSKERLWTNDELRALLPLEKGCAVRLAIVADHVTSCISMFVDSETNTKLEDFANRRKFASDMWNSLGNCYISLGVALKVCADQIEGMEFNMIGAHPIEEP